MTFLCSLIVHYLQILRHKEAQINSLTRLSATLSRSHATSLRFVADIMDGKLSDVTEPSALAVTVI